MFTKFTGKHLYQGLILNKVATSEKESGTGISCDFCEILKNTFYDCFSTYANTLSKAIFIPVSFIFVGFLMM